MAKVFYINSLAVDSEIQDFFMVKDIQIKVGSNKKNYLDVTLADKTGEINGKKWDISDEEIESLRIVGGGDLVKIKALVTEWNGVKQLKVSRIRKGQKEDQQEMQDFIKAAPEASEDMYSFICGKASSISDPDLKAMAEDFLSSEKERLMYYPAAMKNHHAEYGGLLYHMKRMLALGEKACEVYSLLDRDWVICGVILHDMEKLNEIESNEYGISPGYSMEGQLLGHIVQGVKKVEEMAERLGVPKEKAIMLEHMIVSHHYEAEFGSPKKPMFPEAELLHYLDMVDAKMFDFEDALSGVDPGKFSERVRTLDGRMLYKATFSKLK